MAACALAGCGGTAYTTDKQWCDAACATLIACGVQNLGDQPTCSSNCQSPAASVFLACAKGGDPTDCNSMSICAIKQACAGVVPSGSNTCSLTLTCETSCAPGNAACGCACISAIAPSKARLILIQNNCVLSNCAGCSDATSCGICLQGHCAQQTQACQSN
jgi:hypothetical protein